MTDKRLNGKVVIVTGSASGVGRATAVLFAEHGARIVVNTDKREDWAAQTVAMVKEVGGEAIFIKGDVSMGVDVKNLVDSAIKKYGQLDVLVNNAASIHPNKLVEMPEQDWDRTMDVVLKATYWGAKFAIPAMIKNGGGAIVNISSINSGLVANPSWPAYTAAKGGLNALTRQLAIDYGAQGIRVNAILPGSLVNERGEERLREEPIEARHRLDSYPVGRLGRPIDVAYAALFLASDEASFINGALLVVDGGLTCQTPEALVLPSTRQRWGKDDIYLFPDEEVDPN
jgi:NAD(P)-dependent dehydrogenase (short-subunit alcohol dehydrogenase family)